MCELDVKTNEAEEERSEYQSVTVKNNSSEISRKIRILVGIIGMTVSVLLLFFYKQIFLIFEYNVPMWIWISIPFVLCGLLLFSVILILYERLI